MVGHAIPLEVTMRKLLAAAAALGLLTAALPATASDNPAKTSQPANAAVVTAKIAKIARVKHHAKRVHRQHFVRHHRHHRMALHKVHRKHMALHKHHQVRKTAKPAARN